MLVQGTEKSLYSVTAGKKVYDLFVVGLHLTQHLGIQKDFYIAAGGK